MSVFDSFWTRKYRQHIAAMIGLCYRYVPDRATAEDLAHDAFLKAIEKADTFRMAERFEGWLARITLNTVMDHLREKVLVSDMEAETVAAILPEHDDDIAPETMMEAIRQADFSRGEIVDAIAQLPEHHRVVLNLYVFEKLTHKQIAEKLDISSNTSKSHLMRARKELQIILFNKTKQKKRPLMVTILPLFGIDAAFDRYCCRQVRGFALPPQRPLHISNITSAPTTLPLRVRFHALRAPVAAGLGTAAVGAMLIPFVQHPARQVAPASQHPSPVVAVSASAADSTATVEMTESLPAAPPQPRDKNTALCDQNQTDLGSEYMPDTVSAAPVVVKKILRRSKRTIVIQDSNNR